MSTDSPYGVAIVGCGMIARFHVRAIAEVPGARLAALVALLMDDIGELKRHAHTEGVSAPDEDTWAKMTEAAAWVLVEQYFKDVAKGKWPK